MNCKKCNNLLSGQQTLYCSLKCGKRYLKLQWQKRKKDTVNKAKRAWRKKTGRKTDKAWYFKSKEKQSAHKQVFKALGLGLLKREPCAQCGATKVHGHHPDYSKPLEIIWLCPSHHTQEHIKQKSLMK